MKRNPDYQIAVYYWPNYHVDPGNEATLGQGWTEWELVKNSRSKFEGQDQPRLPLWGYRNDSEPQEMARSIDAMADHGITAVLFDWYRYDEGSFLESPLNNGFLRAPNRDRLQFALMWANHDYVDLFPMKTNTPALWHRGAVTRETFDRVTDDAVRDYFSQPNYWTIGGKPYFSIYELNTLIKGLGGLEQTCAALESFRIRTEAAGFPGLHLNIVGWGLTHSMDLVRSKSMTAPDTSGAFQSEADLLAYFNADSVTWYCWAHLAQPTEPTETYDHWAARSVLFWSQWQNDVRVPFYPHVSVGWDGTPRNYPGGIVVDNTPALLRKYLEHAKKYLDQRPKDQRILTLNAWNEWAEGSYLEPDRKWGLAYLQAIEQTFSGNSMGSDQGQPGMLRTNVKN